MKPRQYRVYRYSVQPKTIVGRKQCCGNCGVGHYFNFFILRHLLMNIFQLQLSTSQLLGEFCYNIRNGANVFPLSCPLHYANTIFASIIAQLMGEAPRIKKKSANFICFRIAAYSPHFTYKRKVQCRANNITKNFILRQSCRHNIACGASHIATEIIY